MRKYRLNLFNLKPGFSLTKDSDRDGKPDWIDCRPHNPRRQDEEEEWERVRKRMKEKNTRQERFDYRDALRREAYNLRDTNIPEKIKIRERMRKKAEDIDDDLYEGM